MIQACATDMARVIEEHAREEKLVAVYNLASRFSASIIAKTAFGQEMNDKFYLRASKLYSDWPNKWQRNLVLILMRFPRFHRFLVQVFRVTSPSIFLHTSILPYPHYFWVDCVLQGLEMNVAISRPKFCQTA